jgi:hypothetical protein
MSSTMSFIRCEPISSLLSPIVRPPEMTVNFSMPGQTMSSGIGVS